MVSEKKKFDGNVVKIAEAIAGDSTGIVTLLVRNGMKFCYFKINSTYLFFLSICVCLIFVYLYRTARHCEGRSNHLSDERTR